MFAIVRNEPLNELFIEAARYKDDDRPKITAEHLRSAIHAFNVEGMLLLAHFKWTDYNISEIIYTNLCSDIGKAYTQNRDGVVFINPEALLRVNRYALFIARLYKQYKWDLSTFHKFYLTNIRTSYNYGPPAITLHNGLGLILKRFDRAILKTVQETLGLTPEKMLEGLLPWQLDLAEKSSELGEFGITKEHFKAARLILKKT